MSESSIWNELGNLYLKVEAYEEAVNAFLKAIELNPDSNRSYCNLAYAYQQKGDHRKAVSLYRKNIPAIQSTMEKVLLWNRLGDSYRALKDFDNAIAAYKMADDLETEFSITGLDGKPNPDSPLRDFRPSRPAQRPPAEAARRDPAETFRQLTGASSWPVQPGPARELRTYHQPVEAARPAVSEPPRGAAGETSPARQPGERRETAPTDLLVQEAGEAAPQPPACILLPGTLEKPDPLPPDSAADETHDQVPEETQTRIDVYEKITSLNPGNDRAWDTLGKLFKSCGRFPQAISAFERAIAAAPNREAYFYHLGLIYTVQKDLERAIWAFENVIRLNPAYAIAHGALAGIYRRMGRTEDSDRHITIALPLMDNESAYNQACFHAICGNTDQAIALLKTALSNQDTTVEWIEADPDLDLIRSDPRYRELVDGDGRAGTPAPVAAAPAGRFDRSREFFAQSTGPR